MEVKTKEMKNTMKNQDTEQWLETEFHSITS